MILKCIHIASSWFAAGKVVPGFYDGIKHTNVSRNSEENSTNARCFQQQVLEQSPVPDVPEMTGRELSMSTWAHVQTDRKFCSLESPDSLLGWRDWHGKVGQLSFHLFIGQENSDLRNQQLKLRK